MTPDRRIAAWLWAVASGLIVLMLPLPAGAESPELRGSAHSYDVVVTGGVAAKAIEDLRPPPALDSVCPQVISIAGTTYTCTYRPRLASNDSIEAATRVAPTATTTGDVHGAGGAFSSLQSSRVAATQQRDCLVLFGWAN